MRPGEPKKGGGGGQFTWGRATDLSSLNPILDDSNDPNYESDPSLEYDSVLSSNASPSKSVNPHPLSQTLTHDFWVFETQQLKVQTRGKVEEVFSNGSYSSFLAWVRDLHRNKLHSHIFARTVQVTLDKPETDYEVIWGLLELLYTAKFFSSREIRRGFDRVFNNINEIMIDAPNAPEVILELLSTIIAGKALNPFTVLRVPSRVYNLGRGSFVLRNIKQGETVISDFIETLAETKEKIISIVTEYFASGVSETVIDFIKEHKWYGSLVIRKSLELALDRNSREKELCSRLIAEISGHCNPETLVEAFDDILWNSKELLIDVPEASDVISKFIARAVVDDCLPSNFVHEAEIMNDEVVEINILLAAHNILKPKESYTSLESVWGPQIDTIEDLKKIFKTIIQELFDSEDINNAEECIKELGCKNYIHEFIKKIIESVMDKGPREEAIMVQLVKNLEIKGIVMKEQVTTGIKRVENNLQQLVLDVPKAPEILDRIKRQLER